MFAELLTCALGHLQLIVQLFLLLDSFRDGLFLFGQLRLQFLGFLLKLLDSLCVSRFRLLELLHHLRQRGAVGALHRQLLLAMFCVTLLDVEQFVADLGQLEFCLV